jgi:hypothetical protein
MKTKMKTYPLLPVLIIALALCPNVNAAQQSKVSQELWQKAQAIGIVGVIVDIDMPVQPERILSQAAVMEQRQAIREAQNELVAELVGTKHEVGSRMTTVPTIALKVGPDALTVLERSERVKKVTENRVLNPL